jgi:predicted DNA-binding protein with PD1-like motif
MKVRAFETRHLLKAEPGDRYPESFVEVARTHAWGTASLTAIGGVQDVVLAYFDLNTRDYLKFAVPGIVELVYMSGNLSRLQDEPFWHCHAIVGDASGQLRGGHLVSFTVAMTVECWVTPSAAVVARVRDEAIGLNLLNL